ncbi:MAG: hypothetical protein ACJ76I_13625 [Gaiellaceae bacterium]
MSCALAAAPAAADPASGPRETVDQTYTTTVPGAASGLGYSGTYHAANDPKGSPPYMRQMTFYPPSGAVYDTSAPDACTATDLELEARGPAACPPGSIIGSGTTSGIIYEPVAHSFVFDQYSHHLDIVNNTGEQVILVESEGWTVVRGKYQPDGSVVFHSPTCFPAPPAGGCPDDYVLQLGTTSTIGAYTRNGRNYFTTPPTCPAEGYWTTRIHFEWADGTTDDVAPHEPCA